jgi:hypothetical protein
MKMTIKDDTVAAWDELPCGCIVYRAVLNAQGREKVSGKILRGAFLRRPPRADGTLRDTKGLSVYLKEKRSVEDVRSAYNPCYAVGSLHVGRVRDVPVLPALDVIQDAEDHANIAGLPDHGEDDAKAERLATRLAEQTRLVWMK